MGLYGLRRVYVDTGKEGGNPYLGFRVWSLGLETLPLSWNHGNAMEKETDNEIGRGMM